MNSNDIPVEFDYKNVHYKGLLTSVMGAGSKAYYLMIDGFYRGKLNWVEDIEGKGLPRDPANIKYKWRFTSQTGEFEELNDFFAKAVD